MTCTPQTNANLDDIAALIRDNDDFVTCGHVSPDGDCLGSQLSLSWALKALGKRVVNLLATDDAVDESLAFMPGMAEMVPAAQYDGAPRVFLGLDVPSRDRLGEAASAVLDRCDLSVTIDHHASETTMCDEVYVDPDSASASMIVWDLVKRLLPKPPRECAVCAYVGLMTDTGGFRYQNADAAAFRAAVELVERGADPADSAAHVYQSRTKASLALEALCVQRMVMGPGGDWALSWVTQDDMAAVGARKSDTETLIDTLRSIRGVRVACMLREQDGKVRGSLRAKDSTDVAALARQLGGGGHRAAAGITLDMGIDQALLLMQEKVADLVGKAVSEG